MTTDAELDKQEARAFDKAKKVPLSEYTGRFLYFHSEAIGNDGYIEATDVPAELADLKKRGQPIPPYAWACFARGASFDLVRAVEGYVSDEHHESAADWIDTPALKALQPAVNAALKDVVTYEQDESIAVLMPDGTGAIE